MMLFIGYKPKAIIYDKLLPRLVRLSVNLKKFCITRFKNCLSNNEYYLNYTTDQLNRCRRKLLLLKFIKQVWR